MAHHPTRNHPRPIHLLVLNPNSSVDMTNGMEQAIRGMDLPHYLDISMYTAPPSSPASINNQDDIEASTEAVCSEVWLRFADSNTRPAYDAILVACYSSHPLIRKIATLLPHIAVAGIFEASVVATLPLLRPACPGPQGAWGIVTTGAFWEHHLNDAVKRFLGQATKDVNHAFLGVFTTGLNAGDFHGGVAPEMVAQKLKDATRALLQTNHVDCVVMGCAGMAGLQDIIRSVAVEEYGEERARLVYIVDGVRAGIGVLEQMVKNRRMFLPN